MINRLHAQMNRIALEEVEVGLKSKEAREDAALLRTRKVVAGYVVRRVVCNLSHREDMLNDVNIT